MSAAIQQRLDFAKAIAKEAGLHALSKFQGQRTIEFKTPKDIVTEVDMECDHLIRTKIAEAFPSDNLLSEETPDLDQGGDYTWIIDPIDGTINYSRGIPMWGVAVAIAQANHEDPKQTKVIAGAQYLPVFEELFWAYEGGGAWCNEEQISVSRIQELEQFVISNGDYNVGDEDKNNAANQSTIEIEAKLAQRIKCIGSAIVESSFVAAGRIDAYVMQYSHLWDISVGDILVREAGGQVTHLNGDSLSFTDGCNVLFSNGHQHQTLVLEIGATWPAL